jgi:hypothetical protein
MLWVVFCWYLSPALEMLRGKFALGTDPGSEKKDIPIGIQENCVGTNPFHFFPCLPNAMESSHIKHLKLLT